MMLMILIYQSKNFLLFMIIPYCTISKHKISIDANFSNTILILFILSMIMKNRGHLVNFQAMKQPLVYYDQHKDQWNKYTYYFDSDVDPSDTDYQALHHLLSSTFQHARRREHFFTNIDRHPDFTLRCVYSGKILSLNDGLMIEKANQEHSFPQSFQRGSKSGTGRDMHAIFASDSSVNGSRGNIPFGNKGNLIKSDLCGDTYMFNGRRFFDPKINRGALARASLYILVCYKNCANKDYLPFESLEWMIEASQQKVTDWQKHRNQQLYKLQANRNPFIDFPELALKIDFRKGWQGA